MKIERGRKAITRNSDEYDVIIKPAKRVTFDNRRANVLTIRKTKRRMAKRLRISGRKICLEY